jgi:hypothetical protein
MTVGNVKIPIFKKFGNGGNNIRVLDDPKSTFNPVPISDVHEGAGVKDRVEGRSYGGCVSVKKCEHLAQVSSKGFHEPEAVLFGSLVGSLVGENASTLERLETYPANDTPPFVRNVLTGKKKGVLYEVVAGFRIPRKDPIAEPPTHGIGFFNIVAGAGGVRAQNKANDVERVSGQKFGMLVLVNNVVRRGHYEGKILHSLGIVTDSGKGFDLRQLLPPYRKGLI